MDVQEKFIELSGLMCEPTRAKMLWSLLDGRAYTANELALEAGISSSAASNHLAKLLQADLLKVEAQGRHRYYTFARDEVAYVVEALANLVGGYSPLAQEPTEGVQYCRSCYDHLAGYVGVQLTEALVRQGLITETPDAFAVSLEGWQWAAGLGILESEVRHTRRPLARKCLDWSERKPHLAGQFGAAVLGQMINKRWVQRVEFSRELLLTGEGQRQLREQLGITL